jgi:hypothetical protein
MNRTPVQIVGEITADLMKDILKALPNLEAIHSLTHSVLIHGMGGQPRSFYKKLRNNKSVELLWTGWFSNIWWTYLFSFIPGQAGLTKVLELAQLYKLYLEIGGQSMCGLYFIPNGKVKSILEKIIKDRTPDIEDLLENETNYFLLTIDFDSYGSDRHSEIYYRKLVTGNDLDEKIKWILTRTE